MKKFLLGAILTLSMMFNAAFAYPDVENNYWAAKEINELSEQGVLVGYPDGTFQPDELVTRAEFAAMAIRALGQEHTQVAQPVNFTDIDSDFWAYDFIQKALFFDLISAKDNAFRPDDPVSRAEAIMVATNALSDRDISYAKAREILAKKYVDLNTLSEEAVIHYGKAEIFELIVVQPTMQEARIEANRAATRAECAVILYNMKEQAKANPNAKLAYAMKKKTGEGYAIPNVKVDGVIATIPAGTYLPVNVTGYMSSQTSEIGDLYTAKIAQNCVTEENYILIQEGAYVKGQLLDVVKGRWFVKNGVLYLDNALITTVNDQTVKLKGYSNVTKDRNWFMKFVRAVFKGEKLAVPADSTVFIKTFSPIKVDLTNGWILE
ncbi:MAG: S-layer homology domain-containing protein [Fusobacterium sp.]|nr:S-layer homology domain-containing protein [Fusobacterium sp.]